MWSVSEVYLLRIISVLAAVFFAAVYVIFKRAHDRSKMIVETLNREKGVEDDDFYAAMSALFPSMTFSATKQDITPLPKPNRHWLTAAAILCLFAITGCAGNLSQCGAEVYGLGGGRYALMRFDPEGAPLAYQEGDDKTEGVAREWLETCAALPRMR